MESLTYQDIIDGKIAEWQNNLEKLEEAGIAASDSKAKAKKEHFKAAIEAAIVQLRNLDEQETVANTLQTKDKILRIFSSIDKDFKEYGEQTPFML